MKRLFSTSTVPVLIVLALVTLLIPASCGRGRSGLNPMKPQVFNRGSPAGEAAASEPQSLDEALSELDSLPMPPQADPETWLALKTKLRALLTAKLGAGKSVSKCGGYSKDYVKPRNLHWEKDNRLINPSAYGKLIWTYVNDGDYTQDGIVAISDVTPIAA